MKKKILKTHPRTIEAESLQVGPRFPGYSDIQPTLKTMAKVWSLNSKCRCST